MTIDEAIKKYRKLSNSDRTCYPEEAAQIAEWMEELKERRETNFDYVSLMDKRYYDGYNKAIDDFVDSLDKHTQENWVEHQEYGITWNDIERIAEQLKVGDGE